jgi:hypothetical protein
MLKKIISMRREGAVTNRREFMARYTQLKASGSSAQTDQAIKTLVFNYFAAKTASYRNKNFFKRACQTEFKYLDQKVLKLLQDIFSQRGSSRSAPDFFGNFEADFDDVFGRRVAISLLERLSVARFMASVSKEQLKAFGDAPIFRKPAVEGDPYELSLSGPASK